MSLVERFIQIHERRIDDLENLLSELMQRQRSSSSSGGGVGGLATEIRPGKSTSSISASSATSPGSGTVQPLKIDDAGNYANHGPPITALNAGASISSGKRGFVIRIGTEWWFTPEEC